MLIPYIKISILVSIYMIIGRAERVEAWENCHQSYKTHLERPK